MGGAGGGVEDAAEHLERGGFAGSIRSKEPDQFALLDGEGDALDGLDGGRLAGDKSLERAEDAGFLLDRRKCLFEVVDLNDGHKEKKKCGMCDVEFRTRIENDGQLAVDANGPMT